MSCATPGCASRWPPIAAAIPSTPTATDMLEVFREATRILHLDHPSATGQPLPAAGRRGRRLACPTAAASPRHAGRSGAVLSPLHDGAALPPAIRTASCCGQAGGWRPACRIGASWMPSSASPPYQRLKWAATRSRNASHSARLRWSMRVSDSRSTRQPGAHRRRMPRPISLRSGRPMYHSGQAGEP